MPPVAEIERPAEELPVYRVLNEKGFFGDDDTLYQTGAEIVYTGTPNNEFEPLNDAARARMEEFLINQEAHARANAIANGRTFKGVAQDLEAIVAQCTADARRKAAAGDIAMPRHNPDRPERPDQVPLGRRAKKNTAVRGVRAPKAAAKTPARVLGDAQPTGDAEQAI